MELGLRLRVLGAAAVVLVTGLLIVDALLDPISRVDEPLPDLSASTFEGVRLDRAYFGDRPWVIAMWSPG